MHPALLLVLLARCDALHSHAARAQRRFRAGGSCARAKPPGREDVREEPPPWRFPFKYGAPARVEEVPTIVEVKAAKAAEVSRNEALQNWETLVMQLQTRAGSDAVLFTELSAVLEQMVRDAAATNPIDFARFLLSAVSDAASEVASVAVSAAGPALGDEELSLMANRLLRQGYFERDGSSPLLGFLAAPVDVSAEAAWFRRAVRASTLASALYDTENLAQTLRDLQCAPVAGGNTLDVVWRVVDSVAADGVLERHVVLRGFDAGDPGNERSAERAALVDRIVSASPVRVRRFGANATSALSSAVVPNVAAHRGFLEIAEAILRQVAPFLDVPPSARVVFTGHSIGGSLALMLSVLVTQRSADTATGIYLTKSQISVFTFAALPCLRVAPDERPLPDTPVWSSRWPLSGPVTVVGMSPAPRVVRTVSSAAASQPKYTQQSVCATLGMDERAVSAFVQPWDPLVRWYSLDDPCYPLVADLAADGVTVFASGPPRVMRALVKMVMQSASEWPQIRETYRGEAWQNFEHTGDQYLILPEVPRYLADRILSLIVDVPVPEMVVRVNAADLPRALNTAFPLDPFSISLVPAALRSFVHHFHPAYSEPLTTLLARYERSSALVNKQTPGPDAPNANARANKERLSGRLV